MWETDRKCPWVKLPQWGTCTMEYMKSLREFCVSPFVSDIIGSMFHSKNGHQWHPKKNPRPVDISWLQHLIVSANSIFPNQKHGIQSLGPSWCLRLVPCIAWGFAKFSTRKNIRGKQPSFRFLSLLSGMCATFSSSWGPPVFLNSGVTVTVLWQRSVDCLTTKMVCSTCWTFCLFDFWKELLNRCWTKTCANQRPSWNKNNAAGLFTSKGFTMTMAKMTSKQKQVTAAMRHNKVTSSLCGSAFGVVFHLSRWMRSMTSLKTWEASWSPISWEKPVGTKRSFSGL